MGESAHDSPEPLDLRVGAFPAAVVCVQLEVSEVDLRQAADEELELLLVEEAAERGRGEGEMRGSVRTDWLGGCSAWTAGWGHGHKQNTNHN